MITEFSGLTVSLLRLPGGTVEHGESSKAALAREILEELGMEITVGRLTYVVEKTYVKHRKSNHVIYLIYDCKPTSRTPTSVSYLVRETTRWSNAVWTEYESKTQSKKIVPEQISKTIFNRSNEIQHFISV